MKTRTRRRQMKQLHLRTTGGMGIALEGSLDLDDLPEDLAEEVRERLTPRRLSYVVRRKSPSFMPGQQEYEVTIYTTARGGPKKYAFTDQQADPELLDLLDELTSIIISKKMRAKKVAKEQTQAREANPEPPMQPLMAEQPASSDVTQVPSQPVIPETDANSWRQLETGK